MNKKGKKHDFQLQKLWKLLIDKDMTKQALCEAAHLSSSTVAKLTKGENVSTAVLLTICEALQCDISEIAEPVEATNKK
ncbi:helix-turn-helix transcriptional regulator [Ruminococcus sp. Marseille-P6503]|uniref:helix-turn-helix domain-containing protein n=1 Tax=Ruminococcus sp. Marseille-P6503 TaxID=2364796 RepID=UPI00242ADAB0|nr:helix-turn-helix transcriptional regulator [Ruminococcus sp. Marseille-P6503]